MARSTAVTTTAADRLPIAQVCVDVRLPHLDRPFDYLVPASLDDSAQAGVRVRVRLAGRLVNGFVLARTETSDHRVQPLERVISPLPVLLPVIADLSRAVADRYAGTMADVLRAAIPPRHARAEEALLARPAGIDPGAAAPVPDGTGWDAYRGGAGLRSRLLEHQGARVVWSTAPGEDAPERIYEVTRWSLPHGPVVIIAPNARQVTALVAAFTRHGMGHRVCTLTADQGPQARYTAFLTALTRRADIVIGTRAAAFAPVVNPSLLVCWDDADESLVDPQAPGWNARDVLAMRARAMGTADGHPLTLMVGGYGRSVESQAWVESGWAVSLRPSRELLRATAPRVSADPHDLDADTAPARVRDRVFPTVRRALVSGPVLVQVARRGYLPGLACQDCRELARCPTCSGPLAVSSPESPPRCSWCHTSSAINVCRSCGGRRLRATSVGVDRTAEELGRAFPGVPIISSSADHPVAEIPNQPSLAIATPGAEPITAGGYHAVILLDAIAMLSRPGLRNSEETLRRWMFASAQARAQAPVIITAPASLGVVQALIRWDASWWAARDLAERRELGLPPVVRSATIQGSVTALNSVSADLASQPHPRWRIIGPIEVSDKTSRILITAPREDGDALIQVLRALLSTRAVKRTGEPVQIRVDPYHWGTDSPH